MPSTLWKTLAGISGACLASLLLYQVGLAQDTPTPTLTPLPLTPTPLATRFELPPGDTTILVIGAVILVLIILGAVVWVSRRGEQP